MPGLEEVGPIGSRAGAVISRVLALDEADVEAAAMSNPSIVIRDVDADGTAHFVLSVRGIGEGYRSTIGFRTDADVSERVLWPHAPPEAWGREDARMVRFAEEDGTMVYYATYTAFDGSRTTIQLLSTTDFATFDSSPVVGAGAHGKGLALFPRRVNGRYMALTRADRETNGIATCDDLRHWPNHRLLQLPRESFEVLQLGNCGSPIELEEGWLVLTHGVGPMRTRSMGALLPDLDDPTRVLRRARTPIPSATSGSRSPRCPCPSYSPG